MRMRLTRGCAGVVHAGRPLAVIDGIVEVKVAAAAELAAHGLVPVPERSPGPPADRQPDRRPR